MKPVYKEYFKKVSLIWLACLVLFVFAYMLILAPQNKTAKQIKKKLAEKESTYNSAFKSIQLETKLKLDKQIKNIQNDLDDFVVDSEYSANLPFDITRIANEKQIEMVSIKTQGDSSKIELPDCDYIYENSMDIDFAASFNQFATFLNALERHRPVIFVNECTIERSKNDNSGHLVDMNLSVFVRNPQDT